MGCFPPLHHSVLLGLGLTHRTCQEVSLKLVLVFTGVFSQASQAALGGEFKEGEMFTLSTQVIGCNSTFVETNPLKLSTSVCHTLTRWTNRHKATPARLGGVKLHNLNTTKLFFIFLKLKSRVLCSCNCSVFTECLLCAKSCFCCFLF